jgi:hypothetical protein
MMVRGKTTRVPPMTQAILERNKKAETGSFERSALPAPTM